MHLLTFIQMKRPGPLFRAAVLVTQGVVYNLFFLSYILSPKTCHRFVGYLEEEAVRTYTHALADLDAGNIPEWSNMAAPPIAIDYWCVPAPPNRPSKQQQAESQARVARVAAAAGCRPWPSVSCRNTFLSCGEAEFFAVASLPCPLMSAAGAWGSPPRSRTSCWQSARMRRATRT